MRNFNVVSYFEYHEGTGGFHCNYGQNEPNTFGWRTLGTLIHEETIIQFDKIVIAAYKKDVIIYEEGGFAWKRGKQPSFEEMRSLFEAFCEAKMQIINKHETVL